MKEFIETIRATLDRWGELMEIALNALSLLCIVMGVIFSLARSIQERQHSLGYHPLHTYFRMAFGGWLVVALEFLLAADIVGTIISPTKEHLIELGAIAIIRTFLNYFLNKELIEQREIIQKESALFPSPVETKSD
jgi:uncharacterized membrane protein